jgi:hypothetical protein
MNVEMLANSIRERAQDLRRSDENPLTYSELKDDAELLMVLSRLVKGASVARAFGAPGDWGYSHPIGKALSAKGGQ